MEMTDAELIAQVLDDGGNLFAMGGDMPGPYDACSARASRTNPEVVELTLYYSTPDDGDEPEPVELELTVKRKS